MKCIYYKDKAALKWKGQEHIFPAGLGGIEKLPADYVSKDANDYFSKLEDHLMHGSIILIPRSLFGPSKRKDKKEGKRIIVVMENKGNGDSGGIELGYMREGTPYTIPQIYVKKDCIRFAAPPDEGLEGLILLVERLKSYGEKIIRKTNKAIEGENVIFGYSQKTLYIALNPDNSCDDAALRKLIDLAVKKFDTERQIKFAKGQVKSHYEMSETINDYRVFGKIAFNVLAKIKGKEYVLDSAFDKFREWLMGAEDTDYDGFLPLLNQTEVFEQLLPKHSHCHWCALLNVNGDLCGAVCLYNSIQRPMIIAKGRGRDIPFVDGMVCDWQNDKEYRLIEFISHMTGLDKKMERFNINNNKKSIPQIS